MPDYLTWSLALHQMVQLDPWICVWRYAFFHWDCSSLLRASSLFIFILLFFKGVGDFVFERWLGEGLQFVRNIFKFCDWKQVKNTSGACLLVPSTTCCISSIVRKAKYYLLDLNHGKHGKKSPSYISSNSMGSKVRNIPENFAYHNCLKFYVILFLITSMFA